MVEVQCRVSDIQQSDSAMCVYIYIYDYIFIYFFTFSSIRVYYKILSIVPVLCSRVLVGFVFYI